MLASGGKTITLDNGTVTTGEIDYMLYVICYINVKCPDLDNYSAINF